MFQTVERLLHRQKVKCDEIGIIRLKYIKREKLAMALEQQLSSLEKINGSLSLIEYEQLRMENVNYSDKIEERDDELTRLRTAYNTAVQALAHVREKSFIIDQNIEELTQEALKVEDGVNMVNYN